MSIESTICWSTLALLLLPWIGLLLAPWLGLVIGIAPYVGSRIFAPEEAASLSRTFGAAWREYVRAMKLGWL
jgi:protein-S-isoprenylcysteine O-methyltransferase Ste14